MKSSDNRQAGDSNRQAGGKRASCAACQDEARHSFCQELREGLRVRGLWAPEVESDLLSAVFTAIDARANTEAEAAERIQDGVIACTNAK
jgi:hypothetical protein